MNLYYAYIHLCIYTLYILYYDVGLLSNKFFFLNGQVNQNIIRYYKEKYKIITLS